MKNPLENLTQEQKIYLFAFIGVAVYALYVRSKRRQQQATPAVQYVPADGGTGGVIGGGEIDLSSIQDTITAALQGTNEGFTNVQSLIQSATGGLSGQNAALATGLTELGRANSAALAAFQQAETQALDALKTGVFDKITAGVNSLAADITAARGDVTAGFAASRDLATANQQATGGLFAELKTFVTTAFGRVDAGFAQQATKIQQSIDAVNSLAPKLDDIPRSDMIYFLLGSQTTAACAVPNGSSDLGCYNERHAYDSLQWLDNNNNNAAGRSIQSKWGQYVRNGQYDLTAIGREVWRQRGTQSGGGGGNSGGGGGGQGA